MTFWWWYLLRALAPAAWWDGHGWRRRLVLTVYDRGHAAAVRRLERGAIRREVVSS
jgi:hypothetical protein